MGLFSFIGGLLGAGSQKSASRKAEAAQLAYEQKALDQQAQQFGVTQANIHPFIESGTQALGQQGDILGLHGGDVQSSALDALKASPYFQSLFNTGQEAVLQNASATGGLRGGNTQRSLADFGADTFAKTIQQQLANLSGLSTMGANSAAGLGSLSQANSNAITNLYDQQGATRAGGLLTRGGITAGMWNNAGGFLDNAVSSAFPSAGAGGMGSFNLGSLLKGVF